MILFGLFICHGMPIVAFGFPHHAIKHGVIWEAKKALTKQNLNKFMGSQADFNQTILKTISVIPKPKQLLNIDFWIFLSKNMVSKTYQYIKYYISNYFS